MRHFLELVLDVHLKLKDLVSIVGVVDLLSNLRGFLVEASLKEALGMVEFVLDDVWVELGQLVVHVGCTAIVLNVEVAVGKQRKRGSISWRELEFAREDSNHLLYE